MKIASSLPTCNTCLALFFDMAGAAVHIPEKTPKHRRETSLLQTRSNPDFIKAKKRLSVHRRGCPTYQQRRDILDQQAKRQPDWLPLDEEIRDLYR